MKEAIIDAEIYLHRAANSAAEEIEWAQDEWTYVCKMKDAQSNFLAEINKIREQLQQQFGDGPWRLSLALSAANSFRYQVWPSYKENRRQLRKVPGLNELIGWTFGLDEEFDLGVHVIAMSEADDVLGRWSGSAVLVGEDKDLLTVPGQHLFRGEARYVTAEEADMAFMVQTLTGDPSDNYPGLKGVGEVKARKLLEGITKPAEQWRVVLGAYQKAGHGLDYALAMARCARILRPGDPMPPKLWQPPV